MNIKIVMDSCVDFNNEVFDNERIMERVPFKIIIDNEEMVDLDLEQSELVTKMKNSKNKIGTACPSPHEFLEAFKKCKHNFVVTISEKLSGSYNSALFMFLTVKQQLQELVW